jgi:hypothetical protein
MVADSPRHPITWTTSRSGRYASSPVLAPKGPCEPRTTPRAEVQPGRRARPRAWRGQPLPPTAGDPGYEGRDVGRVGSGDDAGQNHGHQCLRSVVDPATHDPRREAAGSRGPGRTGPGGERRDSNPRSPGPQSSRSTSQPGRPGWSRPSTRRGRSRSSSRSSAGSTCSGASCQATGRRNRRIAVGPTDVWRLLVDGQGPP